MTTTTGRVTRSTQRSNTTPATREKSERLDIVMMTSTYALVEGDTDLHQVWLETMECSCKAAQYDLRCSHVMRLIREVAGRAALPAVMFANSPKHAASWARLQESKGKEAMVVETAGYSVVMTGKPVAPVARPTRSHAAIQADADRMFS